MCVHVRTSVCAGTRVFWGASFCFRTFTGAVYDVREGDYMELLEERFLVSNATFLANNPDVRGEVRLSFTSEKSRLASKIFVSRALSFDQHIIHHRQAG